MQGVEKKIPGSGNISSQIGHDYLLVKAILQFLPLKKIIQFRCVCKFFNSITKESVFEPACMKPDGLLLSDEKFAKSLVPVSAKLPPKSTINFLKLDVKVVQSSNGLLLCRDGIGYGQELYILNPTELIWHFPPSVNVARGDGISAIQSIYNLQLSTTLLFNPLKTSKTFQLFSVWCKPCDEVDPKYRIEMYNSRSEKWTLCHKNGNGVPVHELEGPNNRTILNKVGVYWNHSINWCGSDGAVIYFDIKNMELKSVAPPKFTEPPHFTDQDNYKKDYFEECCGRLLLTRGSSTNRAFEIYEMGTCHSKWDFKCKVELDGIAPSFSNPSSNFRIILAQLGDSEMMYVIVEGKKVFIFQHSYGKQSIKELQQELSCEGEFQSFKYIYPAPGSCFPQM